MHLLAGWFEYCLEKNGTDFRGWKWVVTTDSAEETLKLSGLTGPTGQVNSIIYPFKNIFKIKKSQQFWPEAVVFDFSSSG